MPFEAGFAIMVSLTKKAPGHTYFIFEKDRSRLQKSLSDLGGTDVYAHGGTAEGVLREISNALIAAQRRPSVDSMLRFLDEVRDRLGRIIEDARAETPYSARVFSDLVVFTTELVKRQLR